MFIEITITWVPSGFFGYLWIDTKTLLKKDIKLCAKMYVAVNGGQYGCHLGNLTSYGIQEYSIVFLDPKTLI